ncbi:MAG: bifunctional serine/threonine protein kinase/MFS transporter, partial [Acidobacteriota bacterium]
TVYLATHLGTERPVAVKVIAPQFMERPEFVERFRREARAAGRLRHPNVVNVTDFGFAETSDGRAAYLAMEYLDGCTLGEILEEENNLPVAWTLDILEQVCSAVQEAHEQGIIHRDLKPDNIWLEPNQRGGYTVKVLDFGIAKLEEHRPHDSSELIDISVAPNPTHYASGRATIGDNQNDTTVHDSVSPTLILQSATIAQSAESGESRTAIMPIAPLVGDPDTIGTVLVPENGEVDNRVSSASTTTDLTRVGAVIGTPLYMSPEQCRGERLDARSDIYSLGVIAYQMLSGRTPFQGDFTYVMEAHKAFPVPPLDAKKVRKKLKRVIGSALAKNPDERPQSAEAFASTLRSRSEGIFGLLRRAGMIYTEHMPKFLVLSTFFHLPMIVLTVSLMALTIMRASETISLATANILVGINATLLGIISAFCAYLIIGTITWIVTQNLAVPLRPIRLRPALKEARKKWKTFAGTGILSTVVSVLIAIPTCGIGFVVTSILWMLLAAVVMMENKRGWNAIKRSQQLVKRSLGTATAAFLIMFLIPAVSAGIISFMVNITAKAVGQESSKVQKIAEQIKTELKDPSVESTTPATTDAAAAVPTDQATSAEKKDDGVTIGIGNRPGITIGGEEKDMRTRLKDAILESLLQILLLPLQIIATSFTAIIAALLYLKTRQAGGESFEDLLGKFEETEQPRKKWQERVRNRLIQSGRITSRP